MAVPSRGCNGSVDRRGSDGFECGGTEPEAAGPPACELGEDAETLKSGRLSDEACADGGAAVAVVPSRDCNGSVDQLGSDRFECEGTEPEAAGPPACESSGEAAMLKSGHLSEGARANDGAAVTAAPSRDCNGSVGRRGSGWFECEKPEPEAAGSSSRGGGDDDAYPKCASLSGEARTDTTQKRFANELTDVTSRDCNGSASRRGSGWFNCEKPEPGDRHRAEAAATMLT